jgi:Secretion system C-terminal sorting domain/Bacterial pre-peptidase C-terminal domain
MKSLIKPLLIALTVSLVTLSSSFAIAKPGDRRIAPVAYKTGIYTTAEGKLNIAIDKETGGSVDIRLTNTKGLLLFAQRLGKNEKGSRMRLDVNQLQDGTYQVEITNGVETTTHNLTLSTKQTDRPTGRLVAIN